MVKKKFNTIVQYNNLHSYDMSSSKSLKPLVYRPIKLTNDQEMWDIYDERRNKNVQDSFSSLALLLRTGLKTFFPNLPQFPLSPWLSLSPPATILSQHLPRSNLKLATGGEYSVYPKQSLEKRRRRTGLLLQPVVFD